MSSPTSTVTLDPSRIKLLEKAPPNNKISDWQRKILVDWMFELSNAMKFFDDTVHYAVHYLDHFLSIKEETIPKLQLLAGTCTWIAAKFNEVYPPPLDWFEYIASNLYSQQEFLDKEADVLITLDFRLAQPTVKTFLMEYKSVEVCKQADLSLMEKPVLLPSKQASNILNKRKRYSESPPFESISCKYQKLSEKVEIVVHKMMCKVLQNVCKNVCA